MTLIIGENMNSQKSFTNIFILITLSFLLRGTILAQHQHGSDSTQTGKKKMNCCKNMDGSNAEIKSDSMQHSIVREGEIDLVAIDVNEDGMVYQDQMCWNVISDEAGECPICGMKLKEVSLEQAKENLFKHDFKVK
jgi:hypothetical protein